MNAKIDTNSMFNIPINIAEIFIQLQSPLSIAELGIEQRLGCYFGKPDNPKTCVSLRWMESEGVPSPSGELIYDPKSVWQMYRAGELFYITIGYSGESVRAMLRVNATWDDLLLVEQRTGPNWRSVLNNGACELFTLAKMLMTDGMVFHASMVDDNGRGIVYAGHSGEGKSTQAGLWSQVPGALVINEDRVAVRVSSKGAICYGLPWGGSANITLNHQASLSALILLEHSSENEIRRLSPSTAASMLLARTFLPSWDRTLMERAMANLDMLLALVPVYLLRCRPEPEVVNLVRSVL